MLRSLRVVTVLVVLLGAIAAIAIGYPDSDGVKGPLPAGLDNLAVVSLIAIKDSTGQVILNGTFATTEEAADEVERTAAAALQILIAGQSRALPALSVFSVSPS
jgi:hypothetical protein